MTNLTVILLTYNESMHIGRALESIAGIAGQIIVVDSGSTDDTIGIAQAHGAEVLHHPFINHAKQFQWALDNARISGDWVMRLDADEVVEPDLRQEIAAKLPVLPPDVTGIVLKRKHIFMDRWIRHGGRYPLMMLRIFRPGKGHIEDRWMDEHIVVTEGRTVVFDGNFADHNLNDLTFFVDKHNGYATKEAIEVLGRRLDLFRHDHALTSSNASRQASIKRWIKTNLYNRTPFFISSTAYFLWRYIFQLGFLDGYPGLIYHFLQGYWYRFLVGAKLLELQHRIGSLSDREEIVSELSRATGYRFKDDDLETGE